MEISALASGSSGNCFYVGDKGSSILVDAGISAKQILLRMESLNLNPESINGIFITHEHSDHIKGADVFSRKFNVPLFATLFTIKSGFLCSDDSLITPISNTSKTRVGNLVVESFPKSHKAADPVSFTVKGSKKVSVITDAGHACRNIISHVSNSDALFLESNHDENMLLSGPYPWYLKNWIKGDTGHLSNRQAALCVLEHASKNLKHVVLSHLSQTNNTPEMALKTFNSLLKERRNFSPKVSVSSRHEPTPLLRI